MAASLVYTTSHNSYIGSPNSNTNTHRHTHTHTLVFSCFLVVLDSNVFNDCKKMTSIAPKTK